ncbi:MAG: PAS domain S-box protein [Thaumarchaeota archaeon]|nr:PAS domain S-box protein [Nitrososphaerota archaeon]
MRKSLTQRLVFLFIITTVVPIIIAGILTFSLASESLQNENFSKLDVIAKLKVNTIESIFGEIKSDTIIAQKYLNVRTNLPIIFQHYDDVLNPQYIDAKKKLDEQFFGYLNEKTLVDDIILLDKNGIFVYHAGKNISKWFGLEFSFIDSIILESAKNEQQFTTIFLNKSYKSEASMFSIISIYNVNDEFIGYFVLDLNMNEIFDLIQDTTGLGTTGETLLGIKIDNYAVFINPLKYDHNASFTKKIALDDEIARPIREAVQGIEGADLTIDYRATPIIAVWKYIPSLDWGIVAKIDQTEVFSPINSLQQSNVLLAVVFTIIVGIVGFIVSKNIAKPILKLKENAELISLGNHPKPIPAKGHDELASFIKTFNQMSLELFNSRKSLEDFRRALDKSTTVTMTDNDGIITFVNDKFCQLSKYSRDELVGKNHRIMKSGYHSNEFYANMWNTIKNKQIWYGLIKNKDKNGEYFWLDSVIVPILNEDGHIEQFLSIRKDVTQQKILESEIIQKERFSAIGELSARLAHDIRNPLAIIKTSHENLLSLKDDSKSFEKALKRTSRAIDRISHQIDGVMDFLRDSELHLEVIHLKEMFHQLVSESNIPDRIKVNLPKNDMTILADRIKLNSLFSNLIMNALQAIKDKGTITIRISSMSNDMIKIEMEDDGIPIPENDVGKIFDPLFTTKQMGTGLGLASCKNIVEQHHGTISVKSNPVIFKIIFPSGI